MTIPSQYRNMGTLLFFLGTLSTVFFVCLFITQSSLNIQKKRVPDWIAILTLVMACLAGLHSVTIMSCDVAMLFGMNPYKSKIWPCSAAMRAADAADSMAVRRDAIRNLADASDRQ